jgi:hypothetical protein
MISKEAAYSIIEDLVPCIDEQIAFFKKQMRKGIFLKRHLPAVPVYFLEVNN